MNIALFANFSSSPFTFLKNDKSLSIVSSETNFDSKGNKFIKLFLIVESNIQYFVLLFIANFSKT